MTAIWPPKSPPPSVSSGGYPGQPTTSVSAMSGSRAWPQVSDAVRRNMQANRGSDTRPELRVRSLLHGAGLRYRVNLPLPFDRRRRADITFTRVGLYVFVDGCFWHHCPEHFVVPKTRTEFWMTKIERNCARDQETNAQLNELGGIVLRFWEHEPPITAASAIVLTYTQLAAEQS